MKILSISILIKYNNMAKAINNIPIWDNMIFVYSDHKGYYSFKCWCFTNNVPTDMSLPNE